MWLHRDYKDYYHHNSDLVTQQSSQDVWAMREDKKSIALVTFSIKETLTFAKHGKDGTRGFKVTRGKKNICKSNS